MARRVLLRFEASPEIGAGHAVRCSALAQALAAASAECAFACTPATLATVPALADLGFAVIAPKAAGQGQWDTVVIDSYSLGADYESACRAWAGAICVIDDAPGRDHDADILIDQTLGREADAYGKHLPRHCRVLAGARYAMLRPEFKAAPARRFEGRGRRVLVTLGGGDAGATLADVLAALAPALDVICALGAAPDARAQALIDESGARVELHSARMAEHMAWADLAIAGGGTTAWELCCLATPMVLLTLAANQGDGIAALVARGAAVAADGRLAEVVEALLGAPEKRQDLSRAAGALIDGEGASRVAEALLAEPVR